MAIIDYSELIKDLLPKGGCWEYSIDSTLGRLIDGVSQTFTRIESQLGKISDSFFPDKESNFWNKNSVPFLWYGRSAPLNISEESIRYQLDNAGFRNVEVIDASPFGIPFVILIKSKVSTQSVLSCGSPVGSLIRDWRDPALEALIDEIKPAHCEARIEYQEAENEKN